MPNDNNKILKCNHGEKPLKVPFFISFEIKRNYYRGEDYTERACKNFKNHAMKIINYGKK